MANLSSGKVNIHGKEYETVASRVQRFREEHKGKYAIITEIISADADVVVMKATIGEYFSGTHVESAFHPIATGHAEERRSSSQINRTSALENAETSAIGRALATFGMAGTEFASADEVAQAIHQQSTPVEAPKPAVGTPPTELANEIQKRQVKSFLTAMGVAPGDMKQYIMDNFLIDTEKMTKKDAVAIIEAIK